ncbi:MAG TPA: NUDIX hydrolase [Verrucomicrobiales bacterium]|nr:NUDIX hydrolase [Verrucomicrobiales bacterium]|tara:strand:- start:59 stop:622 length:564 start_codon:yes stop_codon:yes gene_type:complete
MSEPDPTRHVQKWEKRESQLLSEHRIFKIREDNAVNPRTGSEHKMVVLECPDWVNIIALTPERELVLVEQYRQGSETVELEIPGGMMDPGETDPVITAVRELTEETGYTGENAHKIGECFANPAIMNNRVHTILIENCRLTNEVQFDAGEDLVTVLVKADDLPKMVKEGKIRHSIVLAALQFFALEK